MDLKYCYSALTVDVISEYCFSTDPQTVAKPDFGRKNFDNIDSFLEISLIVCLLMHCMRKITLTLSSEYPYSLAYEIDVLLTGTRILDLFSSASANYVSRIRS